MATDDEIQALRIVHEHLELGERVLLFGNCRLKGSLVKFFALCCSMLLICAIFAFSLPIFGVITWASMCVPIVLILSLRGQQIGFGALTDRRLLQLCDEGVVKIASRNEVRQVAGTDNKIILMVAKVKANATDQELRLGVKAVQQLELTPVRNLIELVGGKELLIDQLGSSQ